MTQLEDKVFFNEDKKDKKWDFIVKTLLPPEPFTPENIPWINQAMLDWNVQVL